MFYYSVILRYLKKKVNTENGHKILNAYYVFED